MILVLKLLLLVAVDDTFLHIIAAKIVLYFVDGSAQEPPDYGHECPL
jgi:hypothetical protein